LVSATRHWIALDDTFGRLLPASGICHARDRLAHRAAALSNIYLARVLNAITESAAHRDDLSRHIEALQLTHRELTAALTRAWAVDQKQGAPPVEAD
jgi:hypothetical protein